MSDEFALDLDALIVKPADLSEPHQILLVGEQGSGKTHTALSASNVEGLYPMLYLDLEGSTVGVINNFDQSRIDVVPVKDHKTLKTVLNEVLTKKHKYKSVVIDTIDAAQERAINQLQATTTDGFEVWRKVATWLTGNDGDGLMHKLKSAPFLSIVVVHTREEKLDSGAIVQKIKLQGGSKDVIASIPDCVFYSVRKQSKSADGTIVAETVINTVGTKTFPAKNRFNLPPQLIDVDLTDVYAEVRKTKTDNN